MSKTRVEKIKTPKGVFATSEEVEVLRSAIANLSATVINQGNANLGNTVALGKLTEGMKKINERISLLIEMLKQTATFEELERGAVKEAAEELVGEKEKD